MNLNIRVSGPAGLWINSTAEIIWNIFADLGYNILTDIEYESRIKGWVNYFDTIVSHSNPYLTKYCDILLAFNKESLLKSTSTLSAGGVVFLNAKIFASLEENILAEFAQKNITLHSLDIADKYDNTYLVSMLAYYLQIPGDVVVENLKKVFLKKWEVVFEYNKSIYFSTLEKLDFKKSAFVIEKVGEAKPFSYGNKLLALWAVDAKLEYYSAYPMTPASSILSEIIATKKVVYHQAEDEIAVINTALWASFTGKRAMVGTSGWGFALMTEALSFAVQAEFPITVVLSMRAWPSTWTPTFFEQWDLNFALNPTFWDFDHVVLYPSTLEECYEFAWLALNIADTYQCVVIMLMDKQFSELSWTHGALKAPEVQRGKFLETPPTDYKRYEITDDGISPRVQVGTPNGDFIATSYEHDEYGATSEDPEVKKAMTEKRWRKLSNFFQDQNMMWFEVINNDAKKLLITTAATSYTAKEFVKKNPEFGLLIIKVLKPIDERILEYIKDKEEIIFVESNYSGQLENYISKEFGLKYIPNLQISRLRKYDLYPFYMEDFENLKK